MNIEQFQQALLEKGIALSPQQLDQFDTYYRLLVEWQTSRDIIATKQTSRSLSFRTQLNGFRRYIFMRMMIS